MLEIGNKVKINRLGEIEVTDSKGNWWSDAELEYKNDIVNKLGNIRLDLIEKMKKIDFKVGAEEFDDNKGYTVCFCRSKDSAVIKISIKVEKEKEV